MNNDKIEMLIIETGEDNNEFVTTGLWAVIFGTLILSWIWALVTVIEYIKSL